jgi:hypothetical protein
MNKFYQIVTKSEVDGNWVGLFIENSEVYKTYEEAYQKAEELALVHIKKRFNRHLKIDYHIENDKKIIEIFNSVIKDVEKEYYIKELTVI